ncbi:hypothetical protein Hypma_014375 [Hypsizygus marmoreus]|uniref:C2H2-type domain-containing protein n=1 Tax=Hypsizygus marmoreus TaxID=39966 RepID=A0A369JCK6_HYPMA|nr:hypothetical protein Hypma_014375 [Hypsizygus marmoreus]
MTIPSLSLSQCSPIPTTLKSNGNVPALRTPSSASRLKTPLMLPELRFTYESGQHGVFCDSVFACEWEKCSVMIELASAKTELDFQAAVRDHIAIHATPGDVSHPCKWRGCFSSIVFSKKKTPRDLDRHLKTHLPWFFFCHQCKEVAPRRDLFAKHRKTHYIGRVIDEEYDG